MNNTGHRHLTPRCRPPQGLRAGNSTADAWWTPPGRKPDARSAQHREPPLLRQPVERLLHHAAHMGVDLVDVGVVTEPVGDVDRLEHLGDDLGRQWKVGRDRRRQAEREAETQRQGCPCADG